MTTVLLVILGILILAAIGGIVLIYKRQRAAPPSGTAVVVAKPVTDPGQAPWSEQDGAQAGSGDPAGSAHVPAATGSALATTAGPDSEIEKARREALFEIQAMRLQAVHAAAATRAEAETLAAMTRRVAEAEAETTRRGAEKEVEEVRQGLHAEGENRRRQAELEASKIVLEARRTAEQESERLLSGARAAQADNERREKRVAEREDRLDNDRERLEQRLQQLAADEQELQRRSADLESAAEDHRRELERIGGLTSADAKAELLAAVEAEIRRETAIVVRDAEAEAAATAERAARKIIADTIQRVASDQTTESVVSVMHLPSDDMKGRIIGREGRNIRAFESLTGVNVIIDDTPEAVLLSCFEPVRREIGRLTLEKLIADGRIHPNRIEEIYEQSKIEIEQLCRRAGEDAVLEVGIGEVHPDLIGTIGRLRYRTSYGQNVLAHLIECAHIAGIMAAELHLDPVVLKRAAFLHDIGKALTHEVPGSHALIGADLVRKYGEDEDVVHAIEAHHNEVRPETIEAVLTQACDACSSGRPGARRESLESYVHRLEQIEQIAGAHKGVDKVFAMQAGREVRVMVAPEQVDDVGAALLAREVAKQIEADLTYPGQIRVTVVRESRASEIAR